MAHELAPLPYAHDALEPFIDKQTMEIHHGKHHNAYVTNLNKAIAGNAALEGKSIKALIADLASVPDAIRGPVRNNGGGHWNHTFFWRVMGPKAGGAPTGKLAEDIAAAFGSFDAFKAKFTEAALGQFGSGWAWLVKNADGSVAIETTSNAETPFGQAGKTPVLTLDVWEHAYYIDHRNARAKFIEAWWTLVNWDFANKNLA